MASIQLGEKTIEIPDNSSIKQACMDLNIPFGCQSGLCGTCKITIIAGSENLSELTNEENEMAGRDRTHRLACQALINSGKIMIKEE
jgi:ferredoxin